MNVPMEELNRWRAFAEQVRVGCHSVRLMIAQGQRQQAKDRLQALHDAAILAGHGMDRAGADRPQGLPARREADSLLSLASLDTPANRAYLEALRVAWQAGLKVDEERFGPNIGTDGCAQAIEMVLQGVEQEVCGPVGMVRE